MPLAGHDDDSTADGPEIHGPAAPPSRAGPEHAPVRTGAHPDAALLEAVKEAAAGMVSALTSGFPLLRVDSAADRSANASDAARGQHDALGELAAALLRVLPLNAAQDNWSQARHLYADGAAWIATVPAEGLRGASEATAALVAELGRIAVALFEEEVGQLKAINDAGQATLSRLGQATLARLAEGQQLLGAVLAEEAGGGRQLLSAAGQATLERLAEANRVLGGVLEDEVGRLVRRFDRELLSLRPRAPAVAGARHAPPAVMVMGAGGGARRLRYGEAIPELLHGQVAAAAAARRRENGSP